MNDRFRIGSIKFHDSRADENIIEVIGNIHDNADLLEGVNEKATI